ncbi:sugar ABC transporter permease [Labrenzia sp. DG1229]|uniref:carbohydrate ABC transporter permease n=1 Tax=Labrenzia sp. DG1229 TaxID=681847 RepID=UPI00155DB593|nr:sugar ABC transporter permease [Labrenzia sp. DG1229]
MSVSRQRFSKGWLFLLPGLVAMAVIVCSPLALGFRYSLHRVFLYDFDNQLFKGFENYKQAFADPLFLKALNTTVIFTIGCVVICVLFGILVAFLLNSKKVVWRPFWVALFLIPFVMTPVVGGIAWRFLMWQQEFGVINAISGLFGAEPRYWLLDRETALFASIVSNSWHLIPLAILVFYAALSTIPDELYEASHIDGAGPFQALWYVVLPLLRPHILFVSIILLTSAFREFDMIWALTGGGPGRSTTVLSIFAYNRGIANQDMGMANTIAFSMFAFMAVIAWIYITVYRKTLEQNQ